ncbi:hypothetical protein GM418_12265 [Maribellus comscasis]|uniref:Uncharacterized protein n=1 Tax=Maribellus comscasis TaxID=2681766 RepID=A0A6I6K398_9BACT|nr:hypothetical protein [Maribellus comscasis]QGY44404.1 hypothetical protein GM418_12265 [Maribellus comscasis]
MPKHREYPSKARSGKKGSNFTELTDASCKIIAYSEMDTIMHIFDCRLNKKINTKPDYKLRFRLTIGFVVCYLTDINAEDELCYDGMFVKNIQKGLTDTM